MKRICVLLSSLLFMVVLCACGNNAYSEEVKSYCLNSHWGEGEKLVFYNKDEDQYHTKGLRQEIAAGSGKEIGGVIEYSPSQSKSGKVLFRLMDPLYGIEVANTTLKKSAVRNGNAGAWAEKEWVRALDNRDIQKALRFPWELGGTKIAVYNKTTGLYGYDPIIVPAELCASSPEEIGLIACYNGSPKVSDTYLYDATIYNESADAALLSVYKLNERGNADSFYTAWLEEERAAFLYGRAFKGTEERMGEGTKLIARRSRAQNYTSWIVPEDLLASTPEEVAAVLEFTSGTTQITENYYAYYGGPATKIAGITEVVTLRLRDVKNDALFDTVDLHAKSPNSVSGDSFSAQVGDEEIRTAIRGLLEDYLIDRHVRTLLENKQTGGRRLAVWDEAAGHYIAFGHDTLSLEDEKIGGILRLIPDGVSTVSQEYSQFGFGGGTSVTVNRQKLRVEIRTSSNALMNQTTLTAYLPGTVKTGETSVNSDVTEEQIAEWLEKNWKS